MIGEMPQTEARVVVSAINEVTEYREEYEEAKESVLVCNDAYYKNIDESIEEDLLNKAIWMAKKSSFLQKMLFQKMEVLEKVLREFVF